MRKLVLFLFSFAFLFFVQTSHAEGIYTTEKMITVDLGSQRLYAWEGGQIQNQFVVSTGMRYTPTIKGSFKIQRKVPLQDMKGYYPPYEPYHIKDVKNVMYFYGAYAIHGAHWHNKFGSRVTHGCVNLKPADAQWLYDWAQVGTRVEVF